MKRIITSLAIGCFAWYFMIQAQNGPGPGAIAVSQPFNSLSDCEAAKVDMASHGFAIYANSTCRPYGPTESVHVNNSIEDPVQTHDNP